MINVTMVTDKGTITYETTFCLATCVGWNYEDEPPVHEDDLMSRGDLVSLFAVLTAFRLLCLGIEVAALTKVQEKFNELTRSSSSGSSVTPVLGTGGATKPFATLTVVELRAWMVEAGLQNIVSNPKFDMVKAHMLVDVTEEDIADFGDDFPAVFRRTAAKAIQQAVREGVQVGKGATPQGATEALEEEGDARSEQVRGAQLARFAAGAAQKQASRMTDEAASVFTAVSTAFLLVSFVTALQAVFQGLVWSTWFSTKGGITTTMNGDFVMFDST